MVIVSGCCGRRQPPSRPWAAVCASWPLSRSEIAPSSLPRILQLLAVVDEVARLVRVAGRPVAEIVDDDFVALAVDHRVGLGRRAAEGEREIADRHQDRAELHRALGAQILVGEEAADERRQVNQRGIAAVEAGRLAVAKRGNAW